MRSYPAVIGGVSHQLADGPAAALQKEETKPLLLTWPTAWQRPNQPGIRQQGRILSELDKSRQYKVFKGVFD